MLIEPGGGFRAVTVLNRLAHSLIIAHAVGLGAQEIIQALRPDQRVPDRLLKSGRRLGGQHVQRVQPILHFTGQRLRKCLRRSSEIIVKTVDSFVAPGPGVRFRAAVCALIIFL